MSQTRKVTIIPPSTLTGLKTHDLPGKAAGITGVTKALEHVSEEMGLLKGLRILSKLNQRDGFDCPGCAWPEPAHRSKLGEYCENGAKAVAEEDTNKKCDPAFFRRHSVEEMSAWSDFIIGKSGRVTEPMYLPAGSSHYEPISWERAYAIIAEELKAIQPHEAVFYTSGRTSNEAAFLYQLFARRFGTNNLPDCSNMCHESSGVGLGETIGIGKGTVKLEDIYAAEVVLVIGQNPGTNHPRMLSALQKCKKNGGKVIHINPLPEAGTTKFIDPQSPLDVLRGGTKIADYFLQVRIGGDIALLKLLMLELLKHEALRPGQVIDHAFIESHAQGFDAFLSDLKATDRAAALRDCGIDPPLIEEVGSLLASHSRIISCWAMGITQHKHAVNNVREIVNLHLMRGAVGKSGAGLCPVRGHSNVQGDRTMGIYEKPKPEFLDRMDRALNMRSPREHGYDTVEAIEAMDAGKVKVFMAMGGNFISATPDSAFTGKAMQKVGLTIQISTKLNRSHLVTGNHAIILPCISRAETDMQRSGRQFVTVENSMGVVSRSTGSFEPASEHLRSEPAIVCDLAERVFPSRDPIDWSACKENYDVIRDYIEQAIAGFDMYNQRVRQPDGFYLPNGPRESRFTTASGKAEFTVNPLPDIRVPEGKLVMMTIRSHDQYNTTIYGLDDRYRGISNERRVVLMNRNDMEAMQLKERQLVNLINDHGGVVRKAEQFHVLPFDLPVGSCATYFPETNCLVPIDTYADRSKTPMSKFVVISIEA